jgi:guanylate kinase
MESGRTAEFPRQGKVFVFSAASGAGKTTLLDYCKTAVPDVTYSISATTRPPRAHEKNGVHYFFMGLAEFERRIRNDEFAEWEVVHNNYYGTPKKFIDDTIRSGRHIIMDIDVFGKKKFDLLYPDAVGVLILPPSLGLLRQRLERRKSDAKDVIDLRIVNAEKEMAFAQEHGKYEYTVINDDLEKAKAGVVAILKKEINATKARTSNHAP